MKKYVLSLLCLAACDAAIEGPEAGAADILSAKEAQAELDTSSVEPDELAAFSNVLEEYRAMNSRLEAVAYRIQKANVELCPLVDRSVGMSVHTVEDYPEDLRFVARELLPVSETLSVRTLRDGSPADMAGIETGDEIVTVDRQGFEGGAAGSERYAALAQSMFAPEQVTLNIRRDGRTMNFLAEPEDICGYPVHVFYADRVNGHTDGDEVWITSELIRTVSDDVNLALVVAHEMAHAIAGHMDRYPSKSLELEADRMALVMMARAGYDIDRAIGYWSTAVHPEDSGEFSTHPSIQERLTHFQAVRDYIRAKQAAGETLTFY